MTFRALIIGIEQYPDVRDGSIAKSLPETSKSASDFRDWLLAKWKAEGVNAADTHLLLQPAARGRNRGDLGGLRIARKEQSTGADLRLVQNVAARIDEIVVTPGSEMLPDPIDGLVEIEARPSRKRRRLEVRSDSMSERVPSTTNEKPCPLKKK